MLQTDVCERLTCQDRFDDIRRKRGQLQHTPDVAAVDALLFGDVLEVFELPRFQLLLPCVRFGQGSQQRVVLDRSFNGVRFDTVSQDHLPAIAAIEPEGNRTATSNSSESAKPRILQRQSGQIAASNNHSGRQFFRFPEIPGFLVAIFGDRIFMNMEGTRFRGEQD